MTIKTAHTVILAMAIMAVSVSPLLASPPAGRDLGIAAVVGDEAVSSYDVENRMKFIITTAGFSNTPDVIERIRPQVIRSLVDEKLQLQEAAKNDIKVNQADLDGAIAAIEQQRGMPPGTIYHVLESDNVPKDTFTQQIRAQLSWNRLLLKKVRPQVRISDAEITLASKQFTAPSAPKAEIPQEYKISVIALPVDKPDRENEVKRLADKLAKEIRGGASFEEVSRQFSSTTASAGGKVETFWIRLGQLDPNVARPLMQTKVGGITDPVRTTAGYTITKLYETHSLASEKPKATEEKPHDSEVNLKEILLKLKPDAGNKEADVMLQIGEEVAKHPGTCDEQGIASIPNMEDYDIQVNYHKALLSDLTPAVRTITSSLKVGEISTPFASYEGIRLYMLCGKKEVDAKPVDRDQVYNMLLQQKMELEAQKYLRNLRRETFIDIR